MVKNILEVIEENVDLGSLEGRPSPLQYIYSKAGAPSQVRFGEAINFLRNYANEFFNGIIPNKLSCVDKVGGAYFLAKNWKNSRSAQALQTNLANPFQKEASQKNLETREVYK